MIRIKDYDIIQYTLKNQIVIALPQTSETISNTITPVSQRRKKLTEDELAIVLRLVIAMLEGEKQ